MCISDRYMNFKNILISGLFIKRYKRFFVDVQIENKVITAHCPNTGSMKGLLKEGNKVWLSKSNNPDRKLKYTLQIIEDHNSKVGVNTHLTNKIFYESLLNGKIIKLNKISLKLIIISFFFIVFSYSFCCYVTTLT